VHDGTDTGNDSFTYKASDGNTFGNTVTVTINVTAVNDSPVANNDTYPVNEAGTLNINTFVTGVLNNDTDEESANTTLTASVVTGPLHASAFTLNANGTFNYTHDGTDTGNDSFTYKVSDGNSFSNTATVSITVTALNDAPIITSANTANVPENTVSVLTVTSTDEEGNTVTYALTGGADQAKFTINTNSGALSFLAAPNFEVPTDANADNVYIVQVTANDGAGGLTPQTISVTVTNVDEAPAFTSSATNSVPENTTAAQTVVATDPEAATVNYTLTGGADQAKFSIGINSGALTFQSAPNFEAPTDANADNVYLVQVTATDQTAHSTVQNLSITVTNVNEAPSFTSTNTASVPENTTAVKTVTASDPDTIPAFNTLTFSIVGGLDQAKFNITSGGVLTFASPPNFEAPTDNGGNNIYDVKVQVTDGTNPVTQDIAVTVTDVNEAPTANADSYNAIGNTQLRVAGATGSGLTATTSATNPLANDTDPDTNPAFNTLSVVPATGTSANGGNFQTFANGSYIYTAAAGYVGADNFTYQLTDGTNTVNGTENLTVANEVWYIRDVVDAQNAAGGDGRSTNAFDTLAAFNAAATAANDIIFVYSGNTSTTPLSGGITLKNGQKLWGEPFGLNVAAIQLVNAGGTQPRINNGSGAAVLVDTNSAPAGSRQNIEIRQMDLQGSTNGINMTSNAANIVSVTAANNNVRAAGTQGINLNQSSTGTFDATLTANTVTSTGVGIQGRTNTTGTMTINATTHTIASSAGGVDIRTLAGASALRVALDSAGVTATGSGILIDGSVAGTTTITSFANNSISGNTTGNGVQITSATFDSDLATAGFQPVAGGTGVIGAGGNGVGAAGMLLSNVQGNLSFTDLDIVADAGAALKANGTGGGFSLTVTNASAGTMTAVGGAAVDLTSVAANLPLSTLSSTNSASTGVSLDTVTGTFSSGGSITNAAGTDFNVNAGNATVTYSGTITDSTGRLVSVTSTTGGTKTFSGAITDSAGGTGTGINLTNNTGATIDFTAAVNLSTGANPAFTATGGGTVSSSNTSSTLATTTGTALNVANTTIGASGLKFQSINVGTAVTGPASGIILNNTGASGGLTVSGGGVIQHTTSHGINLTTTLSPSFNAMNIHDTGGSGINGTGVTNFTLTGSSFDTNGNLATADQSNVTFNVNVTGTESNLSGAVTITGNTFNKGAWHGIQILNFNGTISNANISSNNFTSNTTTATSKGSAINIQPLGSATTVSNITAATIANNVIANFPSGSGILVQGGNSNAAGPSGTLGTPNTANVIAITGNSIKGLSGAVEMGVSAILATVSGKGVAKFDISNNGTVANPITNVAGVVIGVAANGNTTGEVTTNTNVIVANNTVASGGVSGGCGITFGTSDTPNLTWTINSNTISNTDGNGIIAVSRGVTGTLKVKIQNNTVGAPLTGVRPGIRVDSGNNTSVDESVCLNISGNTSAGSGGSQGIGLRKQGTVTTTNDFGVNGMAATSSPNVEAYVNGLNPAGGGTLLISAMSGFSNCSLP
jgi:VCBS repeat-containing protein